MKRARPGRPTTPAAPAQVHYAAPLGAAVVLGCCAAHALLVGGVAATSVALFGLPAILICAAAVGLWWGRRRR